MDFTLVSFAATLLLRFYAFTALPLFPANAMRTEHEFANLRFYFDFIPLRTPFTICAFTICLRWVSQYIL
jgi:hypothetical protein